MGILATRKSVQFSLAAVLFTLVVPASAEQPPVLPLITQRVDETQRTVLQGNTHPLARPQYDRGAAPPNLPMNRMLLVLKRSPAQESALLSLLDDQQDKASPNYHKWLTPESFGKQFGPADQDIQTVTAWLQSHGFQIGRVAKGKNIIEFSGVASQVQETFHTAIHKYVVNGEEHWANASDPEIPTALTPVVAGVHTLHNFLKQPMIRVAEQKVQARLVTGKDGKPHVTFPGNPPAHALGPADFAIIYNLNPLYQANIDGSGRTIAVVARSDYNDLDLNDFFGVFDLSPPSFERTVNGENPGNLGGSEQLEVTLDLTWSGAIARSSFITPVISGTTNTTDGADLSEAYIVDNNLGDVMTESFGTCEAAFTNTQAQTYSTLAEQAAAQGITYLVASGDSGSEGCDNPDVETIASGPVSVNLLSATPFNLAVGGTIFNEDGHESEYWSSTNDPNTLGSALSYIPEDVWNESCLASTCGAAANIFATGGGASTFFVKPSWQSGVRGIPNDGKRDLPDVSLTAAASNDPYLVCINASCEPDSQGFISFAAVGGTSASTPSFAGIMAIVDRKMAARQGQAGYVLYKLAAGENLSSCNGSNPTTLPVSSCIFNDVTVGDNAVPGEANYGLPSAKYQGTVGYDLATGLGSVNATNLVNKWNTVTFKPTTTTLSLSPTTIVHGQPVNVSIIVAPQSGTGTPTGDVSLITSNNIAPGFFTLSGGTVSSTINSLPGGTYRVTAQYAGDANYGPSTSTPSATITVSPEDTVTTVAAYTVDPQFNFVPFTSGPYGTFVYMRADVKGQSGTSPPGGIVVFRDSAGANSIPGNYEINSQGNAETSNFLNGPFGEHPRGLFALTPGVHSVVAGYFGYPGFYQSASSAVDFTISQTATSNTLAVKGANKGATLTATVNTSSGGNPPSGTVTFFVNGSAVGTPVALTGVQALTTLTGTLQGAQATASYTDTALVNGTRYTVTAAYKGDTNYLSSISPGVPVTLQSDFLFSASKSELDIAAPGSSGELTLGVAALDGYTGTINFSASSCSGLPAGAACHFGPISLSGDGVTTLGITTTAATTSMLPPGNWHRAGWWATLGTFGLAACIWLGVPPKRKRSFNLLALLFCALIITGVGCGGGSSGTSTTPTPPAPPPSTPTPAGNYTVVVTAASGSLKHSVSFTLNVE
jgi:pro-kumamolisin-like protein/Big-like domain-containing protein